VAVGDATASDPTSIERSVSTKIGGRIDRSAARGFRSNLSQDKPSASDPGDSQYELTAATDDGSELTAAGEDGLDDSQVELPAFAPSETLPREAHLTAAFDSASSEVLVASQALERFIGFWGRYHLFVALGFVVASFAVIGFFLVRAMVGQTVSFSTTAVVIGCVVTVALLLLSLSATALCFLLLDLGRNIRQLIVLADLNPNSKRGT
jgi:hypothetical protein